MFIRLPPKLRVWAGLRACRVNSAGAVPSARSIQAGIETHAGAVGVNVGAGCFQDFAGLVEQEVDYRCRRVFAATNRGWSPAPRRRMISKGRVRIAQLAGTEAVLEAGGPVGAERRRWLRRCGTDKQVLRESPRTLHAVSGTVKCCGAPSSVAAADRGRLSAKRAAPCVPRPCRRGNRRRSMLSPRTGDCAVSG